MLRDGNVFCRTNHSFVKENVCQQNFLGVYSLYSLARELLEFYRYCQLLFLKLSLIITSVFCTAEEVERLRCILISYTDQDYF